MESACKKNPTIIEEVLRDPMTLRWNWDTHIQKSYTLTTISSASSEYKEVNCLFTSTARGLTILKLERVENPYLLGQYLLKKHKLQKENSDLSECSLFHGTREECIDGICKFNFDWRKCGTARGHKFGQGVSFSPMVSYAKHYTRIRENVIILAKVLKCKSTVGNHLTRIPPLSYDTTRNIPGSVYVKYEDDDFYPQYVIHFKRF